MQKEAFIFGIGVRILDVVGRVIMSALSLSLYFFWLGDRALLKPDPPPTIEQKEEKDEINLALDQDAVAALRTLGFDKKAAETTVRKIMEIVSELDTTDIIKQALKQRA